MKKVLILTDVYPPAFNPRMGFLVRYLPNYGWDADIITLNTLKDNNFKFLIGNNKIIRIDIRNKDTPNGIIQKIWRIANLRGNFKHNSKLFKKGINSNFNKDEYSLILVSVSWELYILDAGLSVSKKWGVPLVIDLRDIIEQKPVNITSIRGIKNIIGDFVAKSFEKMKIRLRNKALIKAQAITTISLYHVNKLSAFNDNINLIYNGFDADLFRIKHPEKTSAFVIIYTGIVLEKVEQDPTLLFSAIKKLEIGKVIDREHFKVQFYTPINFRSNITDNKLYDAVRNYIEFYDYVDSSQIPRLLLRSSIALVLTNLADNHGPKGVITTKLFDYLGAERPVLCVRSDEGALASIINELKIGVSAKNVDEVCNFILDKWNEWKEKGFTTTKVNHEYKKQFERKFQAKQFVEVFERTAIIP